MSTFYYLVCDKHLERTDACARTAGSLGSPLEDSEATLGPFIVAHHGCPVRIVSENDDDSYEDKFIDWTKENVEEMYFKDRDHLYSD